MSATRRPEMGSRGGATHGPGASREPRHDGRDPLADASFAAWIMNRRLHEVAVDRCAARLDDEDVGAADRLVVAASTSRRSRTSSARPLPALPRAARRSAAPAPDGSAPRTPSAASGAHARSSAPASSPAVRCSRPRRGRGVGRAQSWRFPPAYPSLFSCRARAMAKPGGHLGDYRSGRDPRIISDRDGCKKRIVDPGP